MKTFRIVFAASSALLFACACTKDAKTGSVVPAGGGESPDQVVATWAGKKLTLREVDEGIASEIFEARRKEIEQRVMKDLIDSEAAKAKQSPDDWIRKQVEANTKEPSDDEIAAVFAQSQSQMPPGSTLETMKPQIVQFLQQQQQQKAIGKLADDLRKANNVKILFHEPRKQVEAVGPSRGPENAKVTIVEFSDFQCPFCSRVHDTVEQVMEAYPGKVRLVFRQFPLEFHPKAPKAAEAALCAHEQGQFWQYHDVLFKNQNKLEEDDLKAHAASLGLDAAKFADCLSSGRMKKTIETDQEAGRKVGVSGTPAFFINGQPLSGAQPLSAFKEVIDQELAN